jgi:multicomponent Na+:H+ antiporter subunit B
MTMPGNEEKGMTFIVKTVTKLTLGFILLYGIFVGLSGHSAPGGGFAGGVIIALSLVHVVLAFGKEAALTRLRPALLRLAACAGALIFLFIVMMGLGRNIRGFLDNDIVIPVSEMLIVGFGLFAIFIALVMMAKTDKESGQG